jgi:hypothetical protein
MSTVDGAPATGVAAYGEYLKDQLAAEEKRKASLEQRGLAIVSSAGALVTLLFALGALATKAQDFVLEQEAKVLLVAAVGIFLAAAVSALATNLPTPYENVSPDALRDRLRESPVRDEDAARRDIALTSVKVLRDAKAKNQRKAKLLFGSLLIEVVAVAVVGVAVSIAIL